MVRKGQWVALPYLVAKKLPGLRLSPLGVKEERETVGHGGWVIIVLIEYTLKPSP